MAPSSSPRIKTSRFACNLTQECRQTALIGFAAARDTLCRGNPKGTRPMRHLLLAFALLPACTSFPQVDAAKSSLSADAVAPALLTAEELALLMGDPALAEVAGETAAARAARLRARADALRAQ
jgi:hypothetical protein